jgi:hypothetical protein
MTRVFQDDAHAMMTVVVAKVSHDPDARIVHFNDG